VAACVHFSGERSTPRPGCGHVPRPPTNTRESHDKACRKLAGSCWPRGSRGVLIQADALHTQKPFFRSSTSRGPTSSHMKSKPKGTPASPRSGEQFLYSARSSHSQWFLNAAMSATPPGYSGPNRPLLNFINEAWPGSSWNWLKLVVSGKRPWQSHPSSGKPFFSPSLPPKRQKALLPTGEGPLCIEAGTGSAITQLHEDEHRYGGPGRCVLATLMDPGPSTCSAARPLLGESWVA